MSIGRYFADFAWLGRQYVDSDVAIDVNGERITSVAVGQVCRPGDIHLRGLTLPGFANAHSHAFHRALRGRTHRGGGTFWTWREDMYQVASRLTPDSYFRLARATYAEMALAGISCVGEFHYVHHDQAGIPYAESNAMGEALIAAAGEAGIRITLLDTCYLSGGFGVELAGPQLRFTDGTADQWAARVEKLTDSAQVRIGAAIHSVRAVPADQLSTVARWAHEHATPLHFHLSEQRAENEACCTEHGCTPTQLLADHGALGPLSSAVHATHLSEADIALLGSSRTNACITPTTERDLADGIGPSRDLSDAGAPLTVGSDSNAVIDIFEETRAVELNERLRTERRGHFTAPELMRAATSVGHASLGWPEAGTIETGALADFITVGTGSVRLAGATSPTLLESVLFAAHPADVTDVIVGGRRIVAGGKHTVIADVAGELDGAVRAVLA